MSKISQLYRHAIFYTFANTIESLTPLIMIPILTRYLDKHDYGLWALFQSAVTFLIPAIGLSFRDAIRMRYLQLSPSEFSKYINSATVIIFYLTSLAYLLVIVFNEQITKLLEISLLGLLALVTTSVLYIFFYMTLAICQFADERATFAKLQAVQTVVSLAMTVALIMGGVGWKGCVFGKLAGLSSVMVFAAVFLYRRFSWCHPFRIDAAYKTELVHFAAKYLPVGFFLVVIPFTNRLMLARVNSMEQTSLYAISESFSMGLYILINGFMYAWQPWMFRKLQTPDKDTPKTLMIVASLYILALPVIGVILATIAHFVIPFLLGEKFREVSDFILGNMMLVSGLGTFLIMQSFLHFKQKIGLMSVCSIVIITLNLGSAYILSSRYGAVAVPYGTACAYLAASLLGLAMIGKVYGRKPA